MKIHEYQAKAILGQYHVPVPRGEVAYTADEAELAAKRIGGSVVCGRLARWFEEDRTVAPLRSPDAQACMRASPSYIAADCTWPNIDPAGYSEHCASTPYPFD